MSLYHLLQRLKGVFIYICMYNILTTENSNGNDAKPQFFCVLEDKMQNMGVRKVFYPFS